MRPSVSLTLEPGLERGVPWGRDLYTFVTSAAGHMMRTLQKPRKNRPSKRQVNHRRFLHNMIQRKFADIEAANHRLASALNNNNEKETNMWSLSSQKSETLDQSVFPSEDANLRGHDKCSHHTGTDDMNKSRSTVSVGSHDTETRERKQPEVGHLWKRHPKSQRMCNARKNNRSKASRRKENQNHKLVDFTLLASESGTDSYHSSELLNQPRSAHFSQEGSPTAHQDTSFFTCGQNVDTSSSLSPQLSPLSLDSCDFSMQTFKDVLTQKNTADISESLWTDFIDLFSAGSKDLGGCMDVEAYLESICARQGDEGPEGRVDDVGFSDQSDSCTKICSDRSEVEDMHTETRDHRYEYGYICRGNQGVSINFIGQNKETQFNNRKPSAISYLNPSELQTYQHPNQESSCMLINSENKQNLTPFEGVAQSFSVPFHNPEHRPIPTPPHQDDWLFTDILKDRKSPGCQENVSPFKSNAWIDSFVDIEGEG